jgi:PAS domain S-box-containing protein
LGGNLLKNSLFMGILSSFFVLIIVTACTQSTQSALPNVTQSTTNPLVETTQSNRLLFLGNKNIAPIVFLDGNTPTGIAVDIVSALANHISQPIEIRAMDWKEAQSLVTQGDADALIQINPTDERRKIYDFSDPLLESHFSIFTNSDRMDISGISSLSGLRVGVEAGGLPQQLLSSYPQVTLVIIPNFVDGFRQINENSIDAVVVDYRVGSYEIAKNSIHNIKVTGDPISISYSRIAVKKGNTELLNEINMALQTIKGDGTYQRIIDKWEPTEAVFLTQKQITEKIYLVIIIVLLLLFCIVGSWMATIRKELQKRKITEAKVREQYSTLNGILESTNAFIFSVDKECKYTSFNKAHANAMKNLYGVEIQLGENYLEYLTVAKDREKAIKDLTEAFSGKTLTEITFFGEDSLTRSYFEVTHNPIINSDGSVVGVAILTINISERKRMEDSLRRANRELQAISNCNQLLLRANNEQTLIQDICNIICNEAGYHMSWVGYVENDVEKTVRPMAWAGNENGYLTVANITWADKKRGQGPVGRTIRTGKITSIQDFASDPSGVPWRKHALKRGYRSVVALPLENENKQIFGTLNIYSTESNAFTPEEMRLLGELAGDLAFGIIVLRARSEREIIEQALRESEEKYRNLFEESFDGLFITSPSGKILDMNKKGIQLFGYETKEEILSLDLVKDVYAYPPDRKRILDMVNSKGTAEYEVVVKKKNGQFMDTHCALTAVKNELGVITSYRGIISDITDQKRTQEKVNRLAAIVESSDDAIISKTQDGIITSWNKGAEKIYGYKESEMLGKSISILMPPNHEEELSFILDRVKSGKSIEHMETIRLRKDGQVIDMSLTLSPVFDSEGKIIGTSTIGYNITERKRIEAEIRKLNQDLEQRVKERTAELEFSNHELEAFAYSVSHDLHTPLRHIINYIDLFNENQDKNLDDQSKHYLENIVLSSKEMNLLIDDLLMFSRLGRNELVKTQVDIAAMIKEIIVEFETEIKGREIEWRISEIPPITADKALMRLVLINLISNAIKFTRPRLLSKIEFGAIQKDRSETIFFIRDNGVGFDMKYVDKLFLVFQRLHHSEDFEGTGIGLANVRRIISRHGGKTWAEGDIDHGATFYFSLPNNQ